MESDTQIQLEPASYLKRFLAAFIDGFFLSLLSIITRPSLFGLRGFFLPSFSIGFILVFSFILPFIIFFGYEYFMLSTYSATLGKKMLGLVVLNDNLNKPNSNQIILRILTKYIIFFSSFWILFDKKKKALHDVIAGTIVIQVPQGTKIEWKQHLPQEASQN